MLETKPNTLNKYLLVNTNKHPYPNISVIMSALTMPSLTATSERSFNAIYKQNKPKTMKRTGRLSALIMLQIYRDVVIDKQNVIIKFASKFKERKLFGLQII